MKHASSRAPDLLHGPVFSNMTRFFLPIMLGSLLQQLYSMVDAVVLGRLVGKTALAAVGGSDLAIINLVVGFFVGLASGACVVVSQHYGAGEDGAVRRAVHTAILFSVVIGAVMTALGIGLARPILVLLDPPAETLEDSIVYLQWYFAGMIPSMVYNMGAGILRAVGDSTRPFYFLVVSAVINTVLDLVFVLVFDMGVAGVAWATIIAQGVSALLVVLTLMHSHTCIRLRLRELRIKFDVLKQILFIGVPAAVQMAITAFSNVFVQSYINVFGADCMSGWTAYSKIDQFIVLPMQSISLAATTFVGQNLGHGSLERAHNGTRIGMMMALVTTAVLLVPVLIFAPALVTFFNAKAEVVAYGSLFLRYISPFYLVMCTYQIHAGALRGAGNSRVPMIIMLASFVLFRQLYLFVTARLFPGNVNAVAFAYPAGWVLCSVLMLTYYHKMRLGKGVSLAQSPPGSAAGA